MDMHCRTDYYYENHCNVGLEPGEGGKLHFRLGLSGILGLNKGVMKLSESLKIRPKNLSVYSKYKPKTFFFHSSKSVAFISMKAVLFRSAGGFLCGREEVLGSLLFTSPYNLQKFQQRNHF